MILPFFRYYHRYKPAVTLQPIPMIFFVVNSGSKDIVNGGEYSPDLEGYDGPRDPNMARQKRQKTKKSQR